MRRFRSASISASGSRWSTSCAQCLIALRLAERVGLEEAERSTVYYTALLVNVGCHADAHEQAKWFGDDIALKSGKYEHDLRSVARGGSDDAPRRERATRRLHRFRVGLEFAISGRRDFDGMIARHAAVARALAERLGLSAAVQEAVGASYEHWDGKGGPVAWRAIAIPVAARLAQFAEFVEVAHRLGGTGAALELARNGAAVRSSTRTLYGGCCAPTPKGSSAGSTRAQTWDARDRAEPALGVTLSGDDVRRAPCVRSPTSSTSSRRTRWATRGRWRSSPARPGRSSSCPRTSRASLRRAGLVHDLGRLGVSNAIWDKPGPARRGRVGTGAHCTRI